MIQNEAENKIIITKNKMRKKKTETYYCEQKIIEKPLMTCETKQREERIKSGNGIVWPQISASGHSIDGHRGPRPNHVHSFVHLDHFSMHFAVH